MTVSVLLVDDHQLVRDGLRAIIEKVSDIEVVGDAKDGHEAVKMTKETNPDVVIMDVAMPNLSGIEATRKIVDSKSKSSVVALSMHRDRRYVLRMFEAGAQGYLLKECASEELIKAIRTVAGGVPYFSPSISSVIIDELRDISLRKLKPRPSLLTDREREVLQPIVEGRNVKEIAGLLNVSIKTIEAHRRNMMRKVGVASIAELVRWTIREGYTDP